MGESCVMRVTKSQLNKMQIHLRENSREINVGCDTHRYRWETHKASVLATTGDKALYEQTRPTFWLVEPLLTCAEGRARDFCQLAHACYVLGKALHRHSKGNENVCIVNLINS